jgi:glycosyltransferase involved in cell wall biosynthesis
MHLIVDAQSLQSPDYRRRGVGRYVRNLIRALIGVPGIRVETVFNATLPAPDDDDLRLTTADAGAPRSGEGVYWYQPPLPRTASTIGSDAYFADWLCALTPDVVLLPSIFDEAASMPRFRADRRPLVVAVVHDLIPLLFHRRYLRGAAKRDLYGARLLALDRCDLALANSETTRRDLMRLLRWPGERVATILGAAEPPSGRPVMEDTGSVLRELSIDGPFILTVSGYEGRKNLSGTLAAFAALPAATRREVRIVIVCALSAAQRRTLERVARRLRIQDSVVFTGYVDDAALDVLYRRCRVFLFPSYYEGLGLPVLEALLRGAPVVVSNRSAIPEFAGPGAWLVDPASPTAMARAMSEALAVAYERGADERRRFAAAFEWSTTARVAMQAIETASKRRRESLDAGRLRGLPDPARRRRRVAWVSPVPPALSGIADYSAELLTMLADTLDISLVVSPGATVDPLLSRFPVLRPDQAIRDHEQRPFDLFVYHVGNHERHVYMLDLMRRYSGLTVLHDIALGGLALKAQETGEWFGTIAGTLEAEGSSLATAVRSGKADHDQIVRDATLNGPVLAHSEAVIVHSASSWSRVRGMTAVPVFRVPQGVAAGDVRSQEACRRALGLSSSDFLIVTLGEVTTSKRIDRVLAAIAGLPSDVRDRTTFMVVGGAPPSLRAELEALATRLGIGHGVRFTGRVPLEDFGSFGCAADVCVQLRYPVRGETSAALLRALAAGSVCLVSDVGSFSEVPDDVALRVAPDDREVARLTELFARLHDQPHLARQLRHRAGAWIRSVHTLEHAARLYVAAIALTVARRQAADSEWIDSVSYAVHDRGAAVPESELFDRWSEARRRATAAR